MKPRRTNDTDKNKHANHRGRRLIRKNAQIPEAESHYGGKVERSARVESDGRWIRGII